MDAHFVPNLTFGPKTIEAVRRHEAAVRRAPDDRGTGPLLEEYLDAGCDSITFHVEIDEPIEPTLEAIRAAGRAAGLPSGRPRRSRRSCRSATSSTS